MRRVIPYRTFEGAVRALDNGGRLWNVLTHAADRVITKAELGKAGASGGWAGALLFFDLATSALSEGEREELVLRLEPKLRRRWRQSRPGRLRPHELAEADDPKRPWIVEGFARRLGEDASDCGFVPVVVMVGNVPVTQMQPAAKVFGVWRLSGDGGDGLVLGPKRAALSEGTRVLIGGRLKEGSAGREKGSPRRRYLEARFWTPLE